MHPALGEERGATALDPDVVERAQPPSRSRRRTGSVRTSSDRISSGKITDSRATGRRSSRDSMRSSQAPTDPLLAGPTQPYQAARGKRQRKSGDLDRNPTQTFGVPEPLPPSPGARESNAWFSPSLRTETIPDLSAMAGQSGETAMRTFDGGLGVLPEPSERLQAPAERRPLFDLQARPWLFPALLAATCLAVGMVLGALLFGPRLPAKQGDKDQVLIRCSDPPAGATQR